MTTSADSEARYIKNEQGDNKNEEKKKSDEDSEDTYADKELLAQLEEVITSASSDKIKSKDNT
eukprot:5939809-Ditylum_brightwellii.AAC.1